MGVGSYLRAVLPRSGSRPDTVPDVVLRLEGVRPRPADVARYAAVVGEPRSDRLPLLYPHLLGFGLQLRLMTDPGFPFPPLGLVHVTNEVTATRPLLVGAELDVVVHAAGVRPHPRGRVVDLVTEVREGGEPVWRETSGYLRRERPRDSGGAVPGGAVPGGAVPGGAVPEDSGAPGASDEFDRVTPALHVSAVWRLPAGLGRSYAGVSGDVNPIHLSSWTARPLGFPRAIAHGLWSAAAVLGALQGRLPDAVRYDVQFRRPIPLPGVVRLLTAVTGDRVDAELRGRSGDDQVHLTARVRPL